MRRDYFGGRRGVTMPFVCVMLTAVIGAMALAVDLGRMYYAGAEVQTAADAAALAAARYQQYHTLDGLSAVQGAAQQVAALNLSGGQPVQVQAQDVVPVTYSPTTRAIATSSWNSETYAFTVTAQAAVPGVVGGVGHTVRRSATAWIANVNGGNCVRPIAINYTRFYEEGVTYDTRYSSVGAFAPDFDFWDISSTKYASLPGRTFIVLPPGAKKSYWMNQTPPSGAAPSGYTGKFYSHANWEPVDYSGAGSGTAALYTFAYALGGAEGTAYCSGNQAAVGDVKQPWVARPTPPNSDPAQSDSAYLIFAANQAMISLCNRRGNAPNAFCYNSDGTIGVKTRIMLTDSVNTNGAWTHKVREVGRARIMCYFQSPNDVCATTQMSEIAAKGTWCYFSSTVAPDCGGPYSGYPTGTIMVFLDTPGSTTLTSDLVLGTKPGLTQRVLLAK
ncbi:hypothetical protein tb265_08380 [Gemmatimonadetes bacterium T265]|nr:hypothetical protein tb265_08380 [Gemmatimonadetes bacterium T265]